MSYLIPFETITLKALNINALNTGTTLIAVTEPNKRFYIINSMVELTAVSTFTSAAIISIGYTASAYADLASAQSTTISTLVRKGLTNNGTLFSVAPSTSLYVNVSVGAVAGSYTLNVYLMGFYS
jgi:hypothetical protein